MKFDRKLPGNHGSNTKGFPVTLLRRGISCLNGGLELDVGVSINGGTPKSSIENKIFHEINHPAIGVPPFMEPPIIS
jgi:hypothetical protein